MGQPAPFATCYMVGREDKITKNRTMFPAPKNKAAAGYQGPVKIELLNGTGLLSFTSPNTLFHVSCFLRKPTYSSRLNPSHNRLKFDMCIECLKRTLTFSLKKKHFLPFISNQLNMTHCCKGAALQENI